MPRDVDEQPVAWREAGPAGGDLVALLHGLGGSRTAWEPQLAALAAAGYRAAAWDMPGYGASGPPTEWTFAALASAAAAWIDDLGSGPAHVVGLSMGGMVALHLALAHAQCVRSLVLCDTSPAFGLDGTTAEGWVAARLERIAAGATPATIAGDVIDRITAPGAPAAARAQAAAAMARIDRPAFEAAVRCLPTHDVRDRLSAIRVPALVVVGELDRETPPSYARRLADGIAGSRFVQIGDAGHLANLEQPERFDAALLDFLSALGGELGSP